MRLRYILLLFIAFVSLPSMVKATHIVGGEMTYTCLGNNQYQVQLTIFRDCYYGVPWFDSPASIGVFTSNNMLFTQALVPLNPILNDTLNPTLGSECFVAPPDVCVHTTTYTTTITLPYLPGGYHLVYQRCCRNNTISNIVGPSDTGATYSIEISGQALLECNNSPIFNNWPPLYLCVNQPFEIDQSAVDPDGDSLVYVLCNPLRGATPNNPMPQPPNAPPYLPVQWINPPYNTNNMLNGLPGGVPMTIDPVTGLLTGTPNTIGQFVIGICVEEYRNGVLIGVKRRDYQVNVGVCSIATAAFFAPEIICDSYQVTLANQSQSANSFLWHFDDPANPGATSTLVNPTYTYSDTGLYTITLIAQPGTICSDTFTSQVRILPNSLFVNFSVSTVDCENALTIQVNDSSLDTLTSISSWNWVLKYGAITVTSMEQNPQFTITQPGSATLTLTVMTDNGCEKTLTETFPVIFINDPLTQDSTSVCRGDDGVPLNPNGGFPGAIYSWNPPDYLDDPNSPNPIANPDSTFSYSVTISDGSGLCQIEKTVTVIVSPQVDVMPVIDTIMLGESVQITATENNTYTYLWSPPDGLNGTNIPSPLSTPNESIVYTLLVTDENGCILERTVTIIVLIPCIDPYVFIPTGFSPNGDGKNDVFKIFGNNLEEIYLAVYNRWGELMFETRDPDDGWDGTYKGKLMPPDAYGYYARMRCIGGLLFEKKGNVTLLR